MTQDGSGGMIYAPQSKAHKAAGTESLTERLASSLRQDIAVGIFQPGERLPSAADLTATYNVSRTVVREAIAELRSEGLVDSRKGSGVFVRAKLPVSITPARLESLPQIIEMLELRTAVEVEAAGLAAHRGSPAQHAAIFEALQHMEAGAGSPQLDFEFHRAVARATNNPRFEAFLTELGIDAVPRSRLVDQQKIDAAMDAYYRQLQQEHAHIADAISARDADQARDAMRKHLADGLVRYREALARIDT